jgi:hypothetical protein
VACNYNAKDWNMPSPDCVPVVHFMIPRDALVNRFSLLNPSNLESILIFDLLTPSHAEISQ